MPFYCTINIAGFVCLILIRMELLFRIEPCHLSKISLTTEFEKMCLGKYSGVNYRI